jgi:lipid II:glycine glycyltransferase (peptidoglycan interpeptide bridge formation enzyme)
MIAERPPTVAELAAILQDVATQVPLQVRLRPNPLHNDTWQQAAPPGWVRLPRTGHVLDLTEGFPTVWSRRFRPRTRTAIRKAERANLDIEVGNSPQLVEEFYGLFERSVERWAGKQHEAIALAKWRARQRDPIAKFHILAQAMGSKCRIWLARREGRPAAAILTLQEHNAHYTRGAMDAEHVGATCANFLLHHLAIEAACKAGCQAYHMGETGRSASLAQFKSRFGAVATPYAEYVFEKLPLHWAGERAKSIVKSAIGFRDV